MRTWPFLSVLAHQFERFVNLRRLSGTKYEKSTRLLAYFDRFLIAHRYRHTYLTRDIIESYLAEGLNLSGAYQRNRFMVVRQFCEYLAQSQPDSYVPEGRRGWVQDAPVPYIYSEAEICDLLEKAADLCPQTWHLRPHTYHALFGLLYTTGLRIGEALALNIGDVDLTARRLHIREGKFRKARWVALSPSTSTVLSEYLPRRLHVDFGTADRPLFVSRWKNRLSSSAAETTFRQIREQCGIGKGRKPAPRVHDLRHTFAVRRLLLWYRDGEDVNARLPVLSTYMGHAMVSSTHLYLRATPELFKEAEERFRHHYDQHIANGDTQ